MKKTRPKRTRLRQPRDETDPEELFRKRVERMRNRRGWSQRELARRVNDLGLPISQAAISLLEAGQRVVSLNEAVAIAAALNVLPEVLYRSSLDWEDYSVMRAEQDLYEEPLTPDGAWLQMWTRQRHRSHKRDESIPKEKNR
jgi:transcriptional regulator with XRE-family HTH domain